MVSLGSLLEKASHMRDKATKLSKQQKQVTRDVSFFPLLEHNTC